MGMETIFSVPLFRYRVANWPERKRQILAELPKSEPAFLSAAGDTYTDFFLNQKAGGLPRYKDVVVQAVQPHLQEFADRYPSDVRIDAMWFERSQRSHYHGAHNHGSLGFSAVLYVEFDPAAHRPTRFLAPFMHFYSGGLMEYSPEDVEEGTLLLFPAILIHEAPANTSDKPRTIVSFNIKGGA